MLVSQSSSQLQNRYCFEVVLKVAFHFVKVFAYSTSTSTSTSENEKNVYSKEFQRPSIWNGTNFSVLVEYYYTTRNLRSAYAFDYH